MNDKQIYVVKFVIEKYEDFLRSNVEEVKIFPTLISTVSTDGEKRERMRTRDIGDVIELYINSPDYLVVSDIRRPEKLEQFNFKYIPNR